MFSYDDSAPSGLCDAMHANGGCATERDSRKDEAIVFIFIFATSGLLAWALFRPWVQKWLEVSFHFISYWLIVHADLFRLLGKDDNLFLSRSPVIDKSI